MQTVRVWLDNHKAFANVMLHNSKENNVGV